MGDYIIDKGDSDYNGPPLLQKMLTLYHLVYMECWPAGEGGGNT